VIAVVAGHAFSARAWTSQAIFSWHVGIFFVLTGYLWRPGRSLRTEMSRRARTLLVPYIVWLVLVTAAWWVIRLHRGRPLHEQFFHRLAKGGSYIGMPYSAFWFITALFFAAVLYRALDGLVGRWAPVAALAVGSLGLVAAEHSPEALRSVWWAAGLAVPCLVYVAAGAALRIARPYVPAPLPLGLLLAAAGFAAFVVADVSPPVIKSADFGDPVLTVLAGIMIAVGVIMVAEGLFSGRMRSVPWLTALATAALPVVFTHGLVLVVLADRPLDASVAAFLAAVAVPWAMALAIRRSRTLSSVLL
jgi:fucose 4-O-acetylase-like acetyltransferase